MIWVRKGVVWLLSLLLLLTLLGTAFSTSFNRTLGQPDKVEKYLGESHVYDHFVAYVANQAYKSESNEQFASSAPSVAIKAAAKSSFPPRLVQSGVNTFIDANYAWLEGKTAKPEFRIDLAKAKETFAQKVGRIVKAYTATLPVCKGAQAIKQKNVDPLAATCRQKNVTPAQVGARTTESLSNTTDFLSEPIITPKAVDPNSSKENNKQPYYEKLSQLPKAYQLAKKMPYIYGVLSLLFALGIVFIAVTRRKGLRRLGLVLAAAGALLVAFKFISDFAFQHVEDHIFNSSVVGELQKSLTDFANRVESSMLRTDLIFGIVFLVLAIVVFIALFGTRDKAPRLPDDDAGDGKDEPSGKMPLLKARKRLMRPFGDSIMPLGARPGGPEPEEPKKPQTEPEKPSEEPGGSDKPAGQEQPPAKPKRRKRPRLIQ